VHLFFRSLKNIFQNICYNQKNIFIFAFAKIFRIMKMQRTYSITAALPEFFGVNDGINGGANSVAS
jgi:hypothetical protein